MLTFRDLQGVFKLVGYCWENMPSSLDFLFDWNFSSQIANRIEMTQTLYHTMWIQSSIEIHKLIESVIVSLSVRRRLRRRVSHIEMSILVYHRRLAGSKLQNIINSHLTFDVIHLSLYVDATKAAKTILTIFTLKLKTIRGEGGINQ